MNPANTNGLPSLFDTRFDVIIAGTGLIGFSAARRLASDGLKTLLVEPSGDLIWEISRALENSTPFPSPCTAWNSWLNVPLHPGGSGSACFQAARKEADTAGELLAMAPNCRVLLYAAPMTVESCGGQIQSLIIATKSGSKKLKADRWVDATEHGILARLGGNEMRPRKASARFRSVVAQTLQPESLDEAAKKLASRFPGLLCLPSAHDNERRLRWPAGSKPWHHKVEAVIRAFREIAGPDGFVASHCATSDFPVYSGASVPSAVSPFENLEIASPALRTEPLATLDQRFDLGIACAKAVRQRKADATPGTPVLANLRQEILTCDVAVAGAGTAGALAAIAAARNGAKTLAFDLLPLPGGVGTAGGISIYFHGAPGGMQEEVNARVQEMTSLFTGRPAAPNHWHHHAKALALLRMMEESGAEFLGSTILSGVHRDESGVVKNIELLAGGRALTISAANYVDSTGDGDLCALAGAPFVLGREGDGRCLSYSQTALSVSHSDGKLVLRHFNFDAGWVDPTDPEDLTRARIEGLAQYRQCDWDSPPRILELAPLIGLRQSRHIATDATVSLSHLLTHARFDDAIGRAQTIADTHSVDYEFESDTLAFYYWTCRGFRQRLSCELPYGMLLPRGLRNVWIACRAAGVEVDAAYGVRMQREMQRLGEAAGVAAALAASSKHDSRRVDLDALRAALKKSGALAVAVDTEAPPADETLLSRLDQGTPGIHLWHLANRWDRVKNEVRRRLDVPHEGISFYAAALCAMANDTAGEDRLIAVLNGRETGAAPDEHGGPYGQLIDVPFWLQAVVLLRRIGTKKCLLALRRLMEEPLPPFNVLTTLALTVERLMRRLGSDPVLAEMVEWLSQVQPADACLPPSRSLWRSLHGEPQKPLNNGPGIDATQNHLWQLQLVLARCRELLEAHSRDQPGSARGIS